MNQKEYAEYLKTEHWQEVRKMALENAGNKCVVCGKGDLPLHVHHNTYENIGEERETDVTVLCMNCHKLYHDNYKRDKVREHYRKILAELYMAFKLCHELEAKSCSSAFGYVMQEAAINHAIDIIIPSDSDIDKMEVTVLDLEVN